MHPLLDNLSNLKDAELEQKIFDLSKKYFMTSNTEVKGQMVMVLDGLKEEMNKRRQAQLASLMANRDKTLDKLIKVN
jgi:hypothetical protein